MRGEQLSTACPPAARSWYAMSARFTWGDQLPTLQEARVHAKCLRSVNSVRVSRGGARSFSGCCMRTRLPAAGHSSCSACG